MCVRARVWMLRRGVGARVLWLLYSVVYMGADFSVVAVRRGQGGHHNAGDESLVASTSSVVSRLVGQPFAAMLMLCGGQLYIGRVCSDTLLLQPLLPRLLLVVRTDALALAVV